MANGFIDKARITVRAGNGGNGAVAFHREKYIAAGFIIAIVAMITVLPEYAVDFYYAYRAGQDPASGYVASAAANMTGANRLLIDIPRGKPQGAGDVQGLQRIVHDAIGALIAFGEGKSSAEDTMAALLHAMTALAWHRENVAKAAQPELELGDGQ